MGRQEGRWFAHLTAQPGERDHGEISNGNQGANIPYITCLHQPQTTKVQQICPFHSCSCESPHYMPISCKSSTNPANPTSPDLHILQGLSSGSGEGRSCLASRPPHILLPIIVRKNFYKQLEWREKKTKTQQQNTNNTHGRHSLKRRALGNKGHCTAGHCRTSSSSGYYCLEQKKRLTVAIQRNRHSKTDKMRKQRNISQMKEQNQTTGRNQSKMDISNMTDRDFRDW